MYLSFYRTIGFLCIYLGIITHAFSQETDTFRDCRDGKVYKTIKINCRLWFAENLAFKTDSGSWCYNNNEQNCKTYGRLYNWETAKRACPKGWHLPKNSEWKKLIKSLGGKKFAGGEMKNFKFWSYSIAVTNKNNIGFAAIPSGYRSCTGNFSDLGNSCNFWSKTEFKTINAWNFNLYLYSIQIYNSYGHKKNGFSVRCIQD